jgi:SagB-type dehydrogenase family enzyme
MPQFHQQTKHSYFSIRANSRFLDWNSQLSANKFYPKFFARFSQIPDFEDFDLIGKTSFEYKDRAYSLRTVPSAGALYPCEVYFQSRGVKGLIDGIYHYEQSSSKYTLLHELTDDGIEPYFENGVKFNGITFLISAAYFRSSWKYLNRAIRYIFLDSGHQLGAICAMLNLKSKEYEICFDFDKKTLNKAFGFEDFELFTVALKATKSVQGSVKMLRLSLPFVAPCEYLERNDFIQNAYEESVDYNPLPIALNGLFENISKEDILNRRSIRAFKKEPINALEFDKIFAGLIEFANLNNIDIFYTVHTVLNKGWGLYKNGVLAKSGDFRENSRYLSLEQNIGGDSAATIYFTSNEVQKYQLVNILSGFIGQIIYLRATSFNIGASGIGAYYDDETKKFLDTPNNILYLLAIGR